MTDYNSFVYGEDPTDRVVSVEECDNELEVFRELEDGRIVSELRPHNFWALSHEQYDSAWLPLAGNNHFKYMRRFESQEQQLKVRRRHPDVYVVYDPKEAALIDKGITYYKGMRREDVSVLAFDIESTGIEHGPDSRVILISNTYRRGETVERRLFTYSDYETDAAMFDAWCEWVRARNPSIIVGHNIYGYDLPYMHFCARRAGTELRLGRDNTALYIPEYESKYRKDGSQFYTYRNAKIYGREIVDTFFLSMKYDISKKYENYRLKYLVAAEGMEVEGRVHYDASKIAANYKDPTELKKIQAYAIHDADDALSLFDRMAPAYFYLSQSIPKSFQQIINGASGAWLNSFLVRSYLADQHSVPAASTVHKFEGAISIGNPGVYHNVFKVDVASLYPSIILQYGVSDPAKDPRGYFLRMVEHFTNERLENKRRGKESGDRYFSDMEQAQKIVINSAYGLLGTPGLNFNSPAGAESITRFGREILTKAIEWAKHNHYQIVNADTDSISIAPLDFAVEWDKWSDERRSATVARINSLFPDKIRWEDDGVYDDVLVLKAKNYALRAGSKLKIKGSALKGTNKERALTEFMTRLVTLLLDEGCDEAAALDLYNDYVFEINNLADITRWTCKKTITEAVLNPGRTNEQKVLDALGDTNIQMGDKHYFFYDSEERLVLQENWTGNHDTRRLLEKLFKTVKIFETVLNIRSFPNYALVRNQKVLSQMLNSSPSI